MGLLDKIFKNREKAQPDELSPGGSPIYHYEEEEDKGFRPPEVFGQFAEEIEAHFSALFPDRESFVFHELISDLVHIDVNILKPSPKADYYVMYTTGMSDMPMSLPDGYEDRADLKYGELYMFLPSSWNPGDVGQVSSDISDSEFWPIHMIKYLARFPHEYRTWLGAGHTIPNGPDYEPLCADTKMGGVVLVQTGQDLGSLTTENGTIINFYMMIPAYQEEIEYKLKYGMEALDQKYSEGNLPMILDIHRPNYCEDFKERLD